MQDASSPQTPAPSVIASPGGPKQLSDDLSFEPSLSTASQSLSVIAANLKQSLAKASREIVASGRLLIQAKSLVGHGNFGAWLADNFRMSAKTAHRFMSVAELVQRHQLDNEKVAKLLYLDLQSLYELAAKSTSLSIQTQVLAQLDSGRVSYELIRDWKQIERQGERQDIQTRESESENISRLTTQIERFEAWLSLTEPLMEEASRQLDFESRQALQLHTRQLKETITQVEAILLQIQKQPTIQVEAIPVQEPCPGETGAES